MARRRSYSQSKNNGAISFVGTILVLIVSILEWIKENLVLTIMILLGIVIFVMIICYIIGEFRRKDLINRNSHQKIMNSIHNNMNSNDYETPMEYYKENNNFNDVNQFKSTVKESIINNESLNTEQDSFIIDIMSCSKNDILKLDGFNNKKADKFIKERKNGKMWYNLESFVQDFELQPHEMILIQNKINFPERPRNKYGRKLDI